MESTLAFACPHCHEEYRDDLEVLGLDEPHEIRCSACAKTFTAVIVECASCAADNVFVAREGSPSLEATTCSTCGKALGALDGQEADEFDG